MIGTGATDDGRQDEQRAGSSVKPPRIVGKHAAWAVLLVAGIGHVFVVGAPGAALPMIYAPIVDEFGLSRSAVALMASIKMIAGALLSLAGGWLVARFGIRVTAAVTTALAGISMIAYLTVTSVAELYVVTAVMGAATVFGMVMYTVAISRWFNSNLGVAVAFASLGTSIGGALTPFLMNNAISAYGWRMSMALLAPGIIVVVPLILLFVRPPSAEEAGSRGAHITNLADEPAPLGVTPREITAQPTFWVVGIALFLSSFADQSMIQHLVLYLRTDIHMSETLAAAALALTFSGGFVGKLLFGWVFDRFSLRGLAACYLILGLGAWLMSPMLVALFPILVANTFRGLAHGGIIIDVPVAARHCFGPRALGYVIGVWSAAASLGSAAGPYAVGLMRDAQHNYGGGFALIISASFLAAALMLFARPAYRQQTRRAAAQ